MPRQPSSTVRPLERSEDRHLADLTGEALSDLVRSVNGSTAGASLGEDDPRDRIDLVSFGEGWDAESIRIGRKMVQGWTHLVQWLGRVDDPRRLAAVVRLRPPLGFAGAAETARAATR